MLYTPPELKSREGDGLLYQSLEPVIRGMGYSLIELYVSRQKARGKNPGSVQVRVTVYKNGTIGIEDCSAVHRGILPRLELAFPEPDIYLEVSSPGIDRLIKDGSEFVNYIGREIRCYRTDISGWTSGVLISADEKAITLCCEDGEIILFYEIIAKARLNAAP